jgi:diguanylate cyclase (GGDEF)-like protein
MTPMSSKESHRWEQDVQQALDKVRGLIEDVVRAEQHRNDLTGLPNERSLDRELHQEFAGGNEFWCAFVEIDHFKRLNEIYKYEACDAMLQAVGKHLQLSAQQCFGGARAFHAHGDEFYLLGGEAKAGTIEKGLESVRQHIAAISLPVQGFSEPMSATVTIGWAFRSDLQGTESTAKMFRRIVEDAVAFGKRKGRDQVCRYDSTMKKEDIFSERGNCPQCEAAFTMDVEKSKLEPNPTLWCPNCGATQPRPVRPEGAVAEAEA